MAGPTVTAGQQINVGDLAARVERLEKAVAELSGPTGIASRTGAWYVAHAGQFEDDPVYAQIASRGSAYRPSLRPSERKRHRG